MYALNRTDYPMPVIVRNYLRRLAGDEQGGRPTMPCILLTVPNPALPFMAAVPGAGKRTGDRPRWNAPGRDHSGIWLRNAATGLCLLAAAAVAVSFTAQYQMVDATRRLAVVAGLEAGSYRYGRDTAQSGTCRCWSGQGQPGRAAAAPRIRARSWAVRCRPGSRPRSGWRRPAAIPLPAHRASPHRPAPPGYRPAAAPTARPAQCGPRQAHDRPDTRPPAARRTRWRQTPRHPAHGPRSPAHLKTPGGTGGRADSRANRRINPGILVAVLTRPVVVRRNGKASAQTPLASKGSSQARHTQARGRNLPIPPC